MKKSIFKRGASAMLAFLMCFTTLVGFGGTTAKSLPLSPIHFATNTVELTGSSISSLVGLVQKPTPVAVRCSVRTCIPEKTLVLNAVMLWVRSSLTACPIGQRKQSKSCPKRKSTKTVKDKEAHYGR